MRYIIILALMFQCTLFAKQTFEQKIEARMAKIEKMVAHEKIVLVAEVVVRNLEVKTDNIFSDRPYNLKNIQVNTYVTFEVLDAYKMKKAPKTITAIIPGGKFTFEGKEYINASSNSAHPFLDTGDQMIAGLSIDYDGNYHFYFGEELQLPSTDALIENIEEQRVGKRLKRLYSKKYQQKKGLTSQDIEKEELKYQEEKKALIKEKKEIIKHLRKHLKNKFKRAEVR